ncbi:Gfo/Idh/MocA family oxidoreductase [Verrucomicrobia bacterium]|nr:Gfo/Idh/MocA family oxidoreductase [Verrucomicrobiota bacterium]
MKASSNPSGANESSRREFIKNTGKVTAAGALAGVALPNVHAQGSETVQVALIGCGGRGTGAAANALSVSNGPTKIVAMADVFQYRLDGSFNTLNKRFKDQMEVPPDRKFIGFDGYKHAIDSLNKGDVAIFTTPLAFRWVHFKYAIEKGVNVFMEKPLTADGPTTRRMIELAKKASEKNIKVGVGLMVRHCRARQELFDRIQNGEIGDILNMRAYRMHGPVGSAFSGPNPGNVSELMYQIQRFHSFLWASGGLYNDFYIHQVDECCWMKNAWPIKAHALGGRHYRAEDAIDQNFDSYAVEYTFEDGSKFQLNGRTMLGCHDNFASYAHGTKGLGIVSTSSHSPGRCRTFNGQNLSRRNMIWSYPQPEKNPYQLEWDDLLDAIRNDKPYNEVERGATASLVSSMGRMAAHTGQEITYDQIYNSDHEFAPDVDKLTLESDAPLSKLADGTYPIPQPGIVRDREYREAENA